MRDIRLMAQAQTYIDGGNALIATATQAYLNAGFTEEQVTKVNTTDLVPRSPHRHRRRRSLEGQVHLRPVRRPAAGRPSPAPDDRPRPTTPPPLRRRLVLGAVAAPPMRLGAGRPGRHRPAI